MPGVFDLVGAEDDTDSDGDHEAVAEADAAQGALRGLDDHPLVQRAKRQLRTSKARAAALSVKRLRRLREADGVKSTSQSEDPSTSYQQQLQQRFFTPSWNMMPTKQAGEPDPKQQFFRERARAAWSFLTGLRSALTDVFCNRGQIQHVLHTCICDDTSTRMRASGTGKSVVHTVCNTVEATFLRYVSGESQIMYIPTPVRILHSGKAEAIHQAALSWATVTANGTGQFWKKLGLPVENAVAAEWRTCVFIGDALKANDKAWSLEANTRNRSSLGLRIKCCNHQLSLVRRPAVLSVERFWSTLVRLGHLCESSAFRKSLAQALVTLLQRDGNFVRSSPQLFRMPTGSAGPFFAVYSFRFPGFRGGTVAQ